MNTNCLPTSIATGREGLAGERQTNSWQGSETRAIHAGQRLAMRPAAGTAEVDWDAWVASSWPHAVVLLIHP